MRVDMDRGYRKFLAAAMAAVISGSVLPAHSCGPDFPIAVVVNGIHPDFPLKFFAAGNLGIIQPTWAQSYLIVSYRYLSGGSLDKNEQASIYSLWRHRLSSNGANEGDEVPTACVDYFKLCAQIRGEKIKAGATQSDFSFDENIQDDAFKNALTNLKQMVARYGAASAQVKDWLSAQDMVFGANPGRFKSEPPELAAGADSYTTAQRAYQIAAARFYAGDFEKAAKQFEALAKCADFPNKELASYMAARAQANNVLDPEDQAATDSALAYIRGLIAANTNARYFADLLDLVEMIQIQNNPIETTMEHLVKAVMTPHSHRFGNDVGDLTFLIDQHVIARSGQEVPDEQKLRQESVLYRKKHDLLDWLACMQQTDDLYYYQSKEEQQAIPIERKTKANHALERWRKTRATTWLVAALCHNDLLAKNNADLMAAALHEAPSSPAYLTARFYLIDSLIRKGHKNEARKYLHEVLSEKQMPPTSKNLFLRQQLALSQTINEYLKNVVQPSLATTIWINTNQLPDKWYDLEKENAFYTDEPVIPCDDTANDLNDNLPLSYWLAMARDNSLPLPFRKRAVRAAWLRSKLLGQENQLDDLLVKYYPGTKKLMAVYKAAPAGAAKRFALACLVMANYGMSPYLSAGIERHGDNIDDFDSFHNNYWIPRQPHPASQNKKPSSLEENLYEEEGGLYNLASLETKHRLQAYSKPIISSLLNAAERRQVIVERELIYKNHPSRLFGEAALEWAKLHPHDARLPHLLYTIVKLPRWTGQNPPDSLIESRLPVASKYSRAAFLLLHKQYPTNTWTSNADVWY